MHNSCNSLSYTKFLRIHAASKRIGSYQVWVQVVSSAAQAKLVLFYRSPLHWLSIPCYCTPQTTDASTRWTEHQVKDHTIQNYQLHLAYPPKYCNISNIYKTNNISNCNFVIFGSPKRLNGIQDISVQAEGTRIERTLSFKHLGAALNKSKSMYRLDHVDAKSIKVNQTINLCQKERWTKTKITVRTQQKDTIQNLKLSCVRVLTYWLNMVHIWSTRCHTTT